MWQIHCSQIHYVSIYISPGQGGAFDDKSEGCYFSINISLAMCGTARVNITYCSRDGNFSIPRPCVRDRAGLWVGCQILFTLGSSHRTAFWSGSELWPGEWDSFKVNKITRKQLTRKVETLQSNIIIESLSSPIWNVFNIFKLRITLKLVKGLEFN